ncbi:MAG: hypothetical protein H0U73_06010 [Tatlockia sp.]|nr:hypothetical protein [Tatlockia sp.]
MDSIVNGGSAPCPTLGKREKETSGQGRRPTRFDLKLFSTSRSGTGNNNF